MRSIGARYRRRALDVEPERVERLSHVGSSLLELGFGGAAVLDPVCALACVLDRPRLLERVDDDADEDVEDQDAPMSA